MNESKECAELRKMVSETADKLIEHCNAVVVMVAFDEANGQTDQSFFSFRGGCHTAMGLADEFLYIRHVGRHSAPEDP